MLHERTKSNKLINIYLFILLPDVLKTHIIVISFSFNNKLKVQESGTCFLTCTSCSQIGLICAASKAG